MNTASDLTSTLQTLKAELEESLGIATANGKEACVGPCPDEVDLATAYTEQARLAQQKAQSYARLEQVNAALARVASNAYGICVDCHQPIDPERLEIIPETPRCTECARLVK